MYPHEEKIRTGKKWKCDDGYWKFTKEGLYLAWHGYSGRGGDGAYSRGLIRHGNYPEMIGWISWVERKNWSTPCVIGSLVIALFDIFGVQGCSSKNYVMKNNDYWREHFFFKYPRLKMWRDGGIYDLRKHPITNELYYLCEKHSVEDNNGKE